jgi:hypothetical protein
MSNTPTEENILFEESLHYHLYLEPEPKLDGLDVNDAEGRATHIEEEEKGQAEDIDTGMSQTLQKIACF